MQELATEFTETDSSKLDEETFREAAGSPGPLRDFLIKVQYMDHAGNMEPALDLFRLLVDGEDMVSREAFVDSVRNSRGRIKSKHLLAVRREIRKTDPILQEADTHLGRVAVQLLDLQARAALSSAGRSDEQPDGPAGSSVAEPPEGRTGSVPQVGASWADPSDPQGQSPLQPRQLFTDPPEAASDQDRPPSQISSPAGGQPDGLWPAAGQRPSPLGLFERARGGEPDDLEDLRLELQCRVSGMAGRVERRLRGAEHDADTWKRGVSRGPSSLTHSTCTLASNHSVT